MTEPLKSVWQGTFHAFGIDLVCHVLSNGERVIEEDSMIKLIEAFELGNGSPDHPDTAKLMSFISENPQ